MRTERVLCEFFLDAHPEDAALLLERMDSGEATELLGRFSPRAAARALMRMELSAGAACLARWPDEGVAEILDSVTVDGAARLMRRMRDEDRDRLIGRARKPVAEPLRRLLRYPESTAGALMDPLVPTLPDDISVTEARRRVQRYAHLIIYYLYVVDRSQSLIGVLTLRELMRAAPGKRLAEVVRKGVRCLSARAGRTAILNHAGWREFHALPVVDDSGSLVGVIRYETLRQLEREAVTERGPDPLAVGLALGRLYWDAAAALLRGVAGSFRDLTEGERQ